MEIKLIKIDNESYFVYQSLRKVYKERVADIMYFARGGRRVTMYSRESGEIELYCSLVEIYRVLITEGFHYINQSVLINISYITNIKKNLAKVGNGKYIEISRNRRALIINKFCETLK